MLLNTVPRPKPPHRIRVEDLTPDLSKPSVPAGQVTKVVDNKLSKTILYAYDAAGRRTSLNGPEASDTQAWSFDAVGQVTKITENSNDRAEWLYDLAGSQTKLTYGSGSYGTWEFDAAGRLTNLVHKKSGGSVIQSFAYEIDDVGNRTKLTLTGGDHIEYEYDPLYQLTKEHRKTSGAATQYWNEFYYDYISNRSKLRHNDGTSTTTTTYSYNAADQLTRDITGATTTDYNCDANGALTRKSSGGNNYDYLYDARSLVTKYDAPGTSSDTTYAWDLLDRRVKKDLNSSVTRFLYDASIGEIIAEYDGSGTPVLQTSYVPMDLDSDLSTTRSGTLYYFHPDALQSTWNLTQASDESVQNTYAYQAFGGQYGSPTENVSNTRRFAGAEWNLEDGTQIHGIRRYLPTVGRWNMRDSLLDIDGPHLYRFVNNNPVNLIDPTGQQIGIQPSKGYCCIRRSPLSRWCICVDWEFNFGGQTCCRNQRLTFVKQTQVCLTVGYYLCKSKNQGMAWYKPWECRITPAVKRGGVGPIIAPGLGNCPEPGCSGELCAQCSIGYAAATLGIRVCYGSAGFNVSIGYGIGTGTGCGGGGCVRCNS